MGVPVGVGVGDMGVGVGVAGVGVTLGLAFGVGVGSVPVNSVRSGLIPLVFATVESDGAEIEGTASPPPSIATVPVAEI